MGTQNAQSSTREQISVVQQIETLAALMKDMVRSEMGTIRTEIGTIRTEMQINIEQIMSLVKNRISSRNLINTNTPSRELKMTYHQLSTVLRLDTLECHYAGVSFFCWTLSLFYLPTPRRTPSGNFQNAISRFTSCAISVELEKCRIGTRGDSEDMTSLSSFGPSISKLLCRSHWNIPYVNIYIYIYIYIYASSGGKDRNIGLWQDWRGKWLWQTIIPEWLIVYPWAQPVWTIGFPVILQGTYYMPFRVDAQIWYPGSKFGLTQFCDMIQTSRGMSIRQPGSPYLLLTIQEPV